MVNLCIEDDFADRCRTAGAVQGLTLTKFLMGALRTAVTLTDEVVARGNGDYQAGLRKLTSGPKLVPRSPKVDH